MSRKHETKSESKLYGHRLQIGASGAIQENDRESRKAWLLEQFATEQGYRFWRSDNKPIEVWSNKVIQEKLNYIHYNPVEEGLVFRPEDYVYSSAVNYSGQNGLLEITLLS